MNSARMRFRQIGSAAKQFFRAATPVNTDFYKRSDAGVRSAWHRPAARRLNAIMIELEFYLLLISSPKSAKRSVVVLFAFTLWSM
jgi:hypothetical protein